MEINTQSEIGHVYAGTSSGVTTSALLVDDAGTNCDKQKLTNADDKSKSTVPNRKRKTRRFKNRLKCKNTPYFTALRPREKCKKQMITGYPQSEAPNNTTQFLMEYHQEIGDDDMKLRTRDDSVTSASQDSDDGYLCFSPEAVNDYLRKDFSEIYNTLKEEKLTTMSKEELIQLVIEVEDRLSNVTKQLELKNKISDIAALLAEGETNETESKLKLEVKELLVENQRLHNENNRLRGENDELRAENKQLILNQKTNGTSSSSSSSSSCTSDSSNSSSEMDEDPPSPAVVDGEFTKQNDSNVETKNIDLQPGEQVDVIN